MKIVHKIREFYEITKPIRRWDEVIVDLKPDYQSSAFDNSRAEELITYCKKNPQFHIISIKNDVYYNRFMAKADLFMIAEGDQSSIVIYIPDNRSALEKFDQE